ncbi:MAG: cytochrome c-type biogenesis protein CcmH [Alphaproteobacteria bacterium]|nr:MAG: cytochrome c-type biogenesis protein CcmH [Alphaproteobacteria bacterium]
MIARLMIMIALLMPLGASAIGVDEKQLDDPALEQQARAIMKELRCLVCQNQSIEDSNADLARDLRTIVRERLAAGDSPQEVKRFMVERYGEWVLLRPPLNARTIALWVGPLLFLALGGFAAWRLMRRETPQAPPPLSAEEEQRLKQILERDS